MEARTVLPGLFAAFGVLALPGCSSLRVERLSAHPAAEKPFDCPLQEFGTAADVHVPFEALCDIRNSGSRDEAFDFQPSQERPTGETRTIRERKDAERTDAMQETLAAAKREACRCGADAFIWVGKSRWNDGTYVRATVEIRAIRFASPAQNPAAR